MTMPINRLNKKSALFGALSLTAVISTGAALMAVAQADERKQSFSKRVYVGAGVGASVLEPKSHSSSLTVSDGNDFGYHVALGYDFTTRLSAEIYYANLGEAKIAFLGSDVGAVDYAVFGLSGIAYLYNSRSGFSGRAGQAGLSQREGLSLYGRLGVGGVNADSQLDYRVDHRAHLAMGIGAEYGFKNGLAVRGEYLALDSDQSYAKISLLKRFGRANSAPELLTTTPVINVAAQPVTPTTKPEPTVTKAFPSIKFAFDQSDLSPTALAKLSEVLDVLLNSDRKVLLEGHTDWISTEQYNYDLSLRRAQSVRDYLLSKGIESDRVKLVGFGESRPLSSNETSEGRAMNRRVDIRDI